MDVAKKFFISTCLLMLAFTTHAQVSNPTFSRAQLEEDFTIFVNALKEGHPGLYRYTSKEKFEHLFSQARNKIDRDMNEEGFYKLLTPLIANIKCGHTKFHRQGSPDDRFPFHHDRLFPLKLYFADEKAYVLYSYDTSLHILPGSELISINDKGIPEIIRLLRNYITIDGDVQSALYEELNHSFNGYYATFIENKNECGIIYKENGRKIFSTLPTVNLDKITAREAQNVTENKLPLRLTYPADSIALLTIESFYVDENVQKFYPFIDSAFSDIKNRKITNLIIDVRNNEGGEEDWGGYLYSYLADKKFIYYKKLVLTKRGNYSFAKYAEMPPQLTYLEKFIKEKNGEILFTNQKYLYEQQPQKNRFRGNVYMLMNGLSFSVTTELASVVHNNKRAIFVGEESGGAYYGNNSGVFAIVTLPNTKLTMGIPLVGFYSNVAGYPYKSRGILPDYPVTNTVYDILNKRDVVIETTLKLIQHKH